MSPQGSSSASTAGSLIQPSQEVLTWSITPTQGRTRPPPPCRCDLQQQPPFPLLDRTQPSCGLGEDMVRRLRISAGLTATFLLWSVIVTSQPALANYDCVRFLARKATLMGMATTPSLTPTECQRTSLFDPAKTVPMSPLLAQALLPLGRCLQA